MADTMVVDFMVDITDPDTMVVDCTRLDLILQDTTEVITTGMDLGICFDETFF